MYNPFEKDTEEWHVFNALRQTLSEDDTYTPLELAEITHRCVANPFHSPRLKKHQQLTLFDPPST